MKRVDVNVTRERGKTTLSLRVGNERATLVCHTRGVAGLAALLTAATVAADDEFEAEVCVSGDLVTR